MRVWFLFVAVCLCALMFIGRLYTLQVVSGEAYRDQSDRQLVRAGSSIFNRGTISFQTKTGELVTAAGLKSGFLISIDPQMVKDPSETYELISPYVSVSREDFIKSALKQNDRYEEIARRVDESIARSVQDLDIPGVLVERERWRFYPAQSTASHAIGFVAFDGDVQVGRYGIERMYESILRRNTSGMKLNFFAEMFTNLKDTLLGNTKLEGDIVLTIEPVVQKHLETVLAKIQEDWSSDTVGGIVMDPKTGEIIAMGSLPSFNPNEFGTVSDVSVYSNPLVEQVYEMGSIFKPITIASGLDSGVIRPDSTYNDAGFLILNNSRIQNYDGKGRGVVDMQTVLNKSLNTGVAWTAQKIGKEKFASYVQSLFGEKTGIDLPSEAANLIENIKSPRDIEHATASYGQGVAFTPIATIRALATLGNGGVLVTPHLVKNISYALGTKDEIKPVIGARIFSEKTSEEITRMLVKVVDDALLGGKVKMPQYSIAAKTGTAQIADTENRGYYKDRFLHSFFGYFPAYDPDYIVFLYTVYPKGVDYASETLTLPFMDITKFLINYYGVLPDRALNE